MKVEIEAFKIPKLIPQCQNCQECGHIQRYWWARCVKARKDSSKVCQM